MYQLEVGIDDSKRITQFSNYNEAYAEFVREVRRNYDHKVQLFEIEVVGTLLYEGEDGEVL